MRCLSFNQSQRVLVFFSLCFLVLNIFSLKAGQSWLTDFGQYLTQAENIIEHKDYSHSYYIGRAVTTPPGYPLILVPLIKMFGWNFLILKMVNVVFFLGFILTFYFISRRFLNDEFSLLISVLFFSSPDFFIFKQYIMTDAAFLFFVSLSVLSFLKYEEYEDCKNRTAANFSLLSAFLLLFYSFFIRWAAIALFCSSAFYFLFKRKDLKAGILICILLLIALFAQFKVGVDGTNYYNEISTPFNSWVKMSFNAMQQTIKTIVIFFFPFKTKFTLGIFFCLEKVLKILAPLSFFVLICVSFLRMRRKVFSLPECFFVFYCVGSLIWYFPGGTRYCYPVVGFLLIYLIKSGYLIDKYLKLKKDTFVSILKILIGFIIFHNAVSISLNYDFDDDQILKPDAAEMIEYLKTSTEETDVFAFGLPRELGFLSKRNMTSYYFLREDDVCRRIKEVKVNYFIFEDYRMKVMLPKRNLTDLPLWALATNGVSIPTNIETGQFSVEEIKKCSIEVNLVWGSNKNYKIYKIVEQ